MDISFDQASSLEILVITNLKKIAAKTKLVVMDDMTLIKLTKKMKEEASTAAKAKAKSSSSAGAK